MRMELTNAEMMTALEALTKAEETGRLGYAIARNRRRITDAVTEYAKIRDELVAKHGTDNGDGSYKLSAAGAAAINKGLSEFAGIAHEVEIMTVPAEVFYGGGLTSGQMFALAFMAEDEADEPDAGETEDEEA